MGDDWGVRGQKSEVFLVPDSVSFYRKLYVPNNLQSKDKGVDKFSKNHLVRRTYCLVFHRIMKNYQPAPNQLYNIT